MKLILLPLSLFLVLACSSKGFNRGELKKQIGIQTPKTTDKDIKTALSKKPNLPKPFKLAIYFSDPKHHNSETPSWLWEQKDKDILFSAINELKKEKMVTKVFPIIRSLAPAEDLKSLRLAAARHGADALLIVNGISDVDRYANHWSWTYALILPAFFVNGSEVEGLFIASASMWDVRNEFLYLTAESESQISESYAPAFGKNDKEVFQETKAKALHDLKEQLLQMIKGS